MEWKGTNLFLPEYVAIRRTACWPWELPFQPRRPRRRCSWFQALCLMSWLPWSRTGTQLPWSLREPVITSYSIHYTKLYECDLRSNQSNKWVTTTFNTAYPGTASRIPKKPNRFPAVRITKMIVIGWTRSVLPIICGEMNLPSINCTTVQTTISLSSMNGDVTEAIIV